MNQFALEKIIVLSIVGLGCLWAIRQHSRILMLLFAVLPFPLALTGASGAGNVCAADCVAAVGFVVLLLRGRSLAVGPAGIPLALFFLISLVSSLASSDLNATLMALVRMALATAVALLLFANWDGDLSVFHRCFATYLASTSVLACLSIYSFVTGGYGASMYTIGIGKNAAGTIYGCAIAVAVAYINTDAVSPRYRRLLLVALGFASVGSLLVLSRGGWISTGAALLLILLLTRRYQTFAVSLAVMVPLMAYVWSLLPERATNYASDVRSDTYVIATRFMTMKGCMDAFESSPVIGVGLDLRRRWEPHNVVVLTLGETGVVGLAAFVAMIAAGGYAFYLAAAAPERRHDPKQWSLIVAGSAVFLVTVGHGLMDVYWRRGASVMGWAAVGMAVCMTARAARAPSAGLRPRRRPLGPGPGRFPSTGPAASPAANRVPRTGPSSGRPPFVLHLLDTDGFAGTEQHVLQLSAGLERLGCRSSIACRTGSPLEAEAGRRGVAAIPLLAGGGLIGRLAAVRRFACRQGVDVLHGHNGRTMLLAAAAAARHGGPVAVGTQHFIDPQHAHYRGPKRWAACAAHRWVNARLARVVAVSEAARSAMISREGLQPDKLVCIPNGIPNPVVARPATEVRAELGIAASDRLVVVVARLAQEKGLDTLLAALPALCAGRPEVRVVIVGDGPLRAALGEQCRRLRLAERTVMFIGFRQDAASVIAAADLFVLPSPAEPFGLVLLEAMALAKPVVAVAAGGPAEIVVDRATGLLVPPLNAAALARAAGELLDDPELAGRFGDAGARRYQDAYTADAMARSTADFYREVVRHAAGRPSIDAAPATSGRVI